jgi:hypothetical protein
VGWRERRSRGGIRVPLEEDGLSRGARRVPAGAGRLVSAVEEDGLCELSSLGITVPFPLVRNPEGRVLESSFGITVP